VKVAELDLEESNDLVGVKVAGVVVTVGVTETGGLKLEDKVIDGVKDKLILFDIV